MLRIFKDKSSLEILRNSQLLKYSLMCLIGLFLTSCGASGSGSKEESSDEEEVRNETLKRCIEVHDFNSEGHEYDSEYETCDTDTFPFIVQENPNFTIDNIMDRVYVSDDWMRDRFYDVLKEFPNELLPLFGVLTAIVIDSSTKRSFYSGMISAIYIDPQFLWTTPAEFNTLNDIDYAELNSGSTGKYFYRARYIDSIGDTAFYFPLFAASHDPLHNSDNIRSFNEVFNGVSMILFHELAHANDFFTSTSIAATQPAVGDTPFQYWNGNGIDSHFGLLSTLYTLVALESEERRQEYSAADAGAFMLSSGANSPYNYTNSFEDAASLFEEFAMLYFLNLTKELVFIEGYLDDLRCDSWTIDWGRLGMIQNPVILERAVYVATRILPAMTNELKNYAVLLAGPTVIAIGKNYCQRYYGE